MKKSLVSVLIFLILTNFIFVNCCYAVDDVTTEDTTSSATDTTEGTSGTTDEDDENNKGRYTAESYKRADESGTAITTMNGGEQEVSAEETGGSVVGTIVGLFAKLFSIYPIVFQSLVSSTLDLGGIVGESSDIDIALIKNIITGKYYLLNCNVFQEPENVEVVGKDDSLLNTLGDIRSEVAKWFIIVRDISMALNLAVLLFVAIRLAIATVSSEKAKYKELLYNWLVSIIILFMLPYIMVFMTEISNALVNMATAFMEDMENAGNVSFENEIIYTVIDSFTKSGGLTYGLYTIIFVILIWTQMKFFLMYGKRMLTVFFLIIVSPIITVTYSIDKIGDGKAQAFSKWMNEFLNNLFVQPIHCFTYLVFMFTANDIAKKAPLVGIIFLLSLTKAEKIVKKLLNVSSKTVDNVGDKFSVKGMKKQLSSMVPKGGGK